MTNQLLFDMMSEIDFDLIERAEAPVPMQKKPIFRAFLIAASLALVLTVLMSAVGIASTAAAVRRVEQNYPEYDGTVLHFVQIVLCEEDNAVSSLLNEDIRQALGSVIAALRQSWGAEHDSSKENTAEPDRETGDPGDDSAVGGGRDPEQTTKPETETEPPTTKTEEDTTYQPPEDQAIFVHSSYDSLYMIAGEREIEVFSANYNQWRKKVEVTDPDVTHLKFRGWLAFTLSSPGTYGYKIDQGEPVYDRSFSKEPEDMVKTVAAYMGGKSCSRMEVLVPVADLAPGEHKVYICVKAANGNESNLVIFTVIIPEGAGEDATEPVPDTDYEPPVDGWSEGLEYTKETRNGETVYVVSGIGSCKDSEVYIPPTYKGYPVAAIGQDAFMSVVVDFVYIPPTVKEIGANAFFDCALKRVELSEGLEVIGESAFSDAYSLEEIVFPSTLKSIGPWAFTATDITKVILPDSVTEVGGYAFNSCLGLKEIKLSEGMTEIRPSMCAGMRNIQSIHLPKGIQVIGEWAFMQCSKLESVTMYHGVTRIGDNIFEYCDEIREIRFVGTPEEWERITMSNQAREVLTPLVVYVEE